VTQGKETIDAIKRVATGRQSYYSDVPLSPIVIKEINIIKP
jgi:cyclophilin family peptidyl-prolyl cis-trans isomerase